MRHYNFQYATSAHCAKHSIFVQKNHAFFGQILESKPNISPNPVSVHVPKLGYVGLGFALFGQKLKF